MSPALAACSLGARTAQTHSSSRTCGRRCAKGVDSSLAPAPALLNKTRLIGFVCLSLDPSRDEQLVSRACLTAFTSFASTPTTLDAFCAKLLVKTLLKRNSVTRSRRAALSALYLLPRRPFATNGSHHSKQSHYLSSRLALILLSWLGECP